MENTLIRSSLNRLIDEESGTCFELTSENFHRLPEAEAELYSLAVHNSDDENTDELIPWCMMLKAQDQREIGDHWHLQCFHNPIQSSSELPLISQQTSQETSFQWHADLALSDNLRTHFEKELPTQFVDQDLIALIVRNLFVFHRVRRNFHEVAVTCHLEGFQLASALLRDVGPPPTLVIDDWRNQLQQYPIGSKNRNVPTSCTFVTDDGILLPISSGIQSWADENSLARSFCQPSENLPLNHVAWPWHSERDIPKIAWLASAGTAQAGPQNAPIKRFKKKPSSLSRRPLIILCVVGVIAILTFGTLVSFFSSGVPEQISSSNQSSKEPTTAPSNETTNQQELTSEPDLKTPELTTFQSMDALTGPDQEFTGPDTADSLLAQLQPSQSNVFSLESLDSNKVISQALASTNPTVIEDADTIAVEPFLSDPLSILSDEKRNPIDEPSEITPAESDLTAAPDGSILIEQTVIIDSSQKKIATVIGKPVLPKQCHVEIELKLAKEFVVEPSEPVTIEGEGKAIWRIAIEDEEPELILEISSKPGSKWQSTFILGLRASVDSPPIRFAPRDAQTVGNRLVQYIQWIDSSILTLQTAKANLRGRSRIDFYGEIKKLEKQRREAEKAIEQWKVIERLSHFFYDDNQVALRLKAVLK